MKTKRAVHYWYPAWLGPLHSQRWRLKLLYFALASAITPGLALVVLVANSMTQPGGVLFVVLYVYVLQLVALLAIANLTVPELKEERRRRREVHN